MEMVGTKNWLTGQLSGRVDSRAIGLPSGETGGWAARVDSPVKNFCLLPVQTYVEFPDIFGGDFGVVVGWFWWWRKSLERVEEFGFGVFGGCYLGVLSFIFTSISFSI